MFIEIGAQHDGASLTQNALAIAAVLSACFSGASIVAQVYINGRHVTAALSANRQKWIDSIRAEIASIFSALWAFNHTVGMGSLDPKRLPYEYEGDARVALHRLRVLLDVGEEAQRDLLGYAQTVVAMRDCDASNEELIASTVQRIVAIELDKMRAGR